MNLLISKVTLFENIFCVFSMEILLITFISADTLISLKAGSSLAVPTFYVIVFQINKEFCSRHFCEF